MRRICYCCSYNIFNILFFQISFHKYCMRYLLVDLAAFVLAAFVVVVAAAVGVVWLVMP